MKRKFKTLTVVLTTICLIVCTFTIVSCVLSKTEHTLSLGNLSTSEASAGTFVRKSSLGDNITFNVSGTVSQLENHVMSMSGVEDSYFYNVTPILGIKKITFNFRNYLDVKLMYGSSLDNMEYVSKSYDKTNRNKDIMIDMSDATNVKYFCLMSFKGADAYLSYFTITYENRTNLDRGELFNRGKDWVKKVSYSLNETITMDFKCTSKSKTNMNIFLMKDATNYFGKFVVSAEGNLSSQYDGLSIVALNDGYYRLSFELGKLTEKTGHPDRVSLIQVRSETKSASGYIVIEPTSNVLKSYFEKQDFTAYRDFIYNLPDGNIDAKHGFMLDVTYDQNQEEQASIALMFGNWETYYGYFTLFADGTTYEIFDVKILRLSEHTYRYFFDNLSALSKSKGNPEKIDLFFMRGDWIYLSGFVSLTAIINGNGY